MWFEYPVFLAPAFRGRGLVVKLTPNNAITLPKAALSGCPDARYFQVASEEGRIVLTPVRIIRADAARAKLTELGVSERDVSDAVVWARDDAPSASQGT